MNALKQLHIYQIPHSQLAVCALPWFCKYWNKSTVLQPVCDSGIPAYTQAWEEGRLGKQNTASKSESECGAC